MLAVHLGRLALCGKSGHQAKGLASRVYLAQHALREVDRDHLAEEWLGVRRTPGHGGGLRETANHQAAAARQVYDLAPLGPLEEVERQLILGIDACKASVSAVLQDWGVQDWGV